MEENSNKKTRVFMFREMVMFFAILWILALLFDGHTGYFI
jgi:hypothetical protein